MMNISLIVNSVKCTVLTRFLQYLRRTMYCYYPSILYEVLILYKYKEGSISTVFFFHVTESEKKNVCLCRCCTSRLYCVLPVVFIDLIKITIIIYKIGQIEVCIQEE